MGTAEFRAVIACASIEDPDKLRRIAPQVEREMETRTGRRVIVAGSRL